MADTVIDSLVVTLGLDSSQFHKALDAVDEELKKTREVIVRHSKEIEQRTKVVTDIFSKLKTGVLGLAASFVSVGAVSKFVENVTKGDAKVSRMAANMGIMTKELSAWENLNPLFGGSKEDADAAMQKTWDLMQAIQGHGGSTAALGPLGRLLGPDGIAKLVTAAQNSDLMEMLRLIQGGVASSTDRGAALNFMQQAGYSSTTFTVMREINDQLQRQLDLQLKINAAQDRDGELAKKRLATYHRITDVIEGAGRDFLNSDKSVGEVLGGIGPSIAKVWKWLTTKSSKPAAPAGASGGGAGGAGSNDKKSFLANLDSKYGLPPGTLWGVYGAESSYGKNLVSKTGVTGPFQITKKTGAAYGHKDRLDFAESADVAGQILRDNLRQYAGNLRKALMAYNAGGAGAAGLDSGAIAYANKIMSSMAKGGSTTSVKIDNVNIVTQATDAKGISRSFATAVSDSYAFAMHGNTGLR